MHQYRNNFPKEIHEIYLPYGVQFIGTQRNRAYEKNGKKDYNEE